MHSPTFVRSFPSTHADAPSSHAIACPPAPCPAPQFESPEGFKRRIRELFEVCVCARCSLVSARLKRISQEYVCVCGFYVLSPSLEVGRGSGAGGCACARLHSVAHFIISYNYLTPAIIPLSPVSFSVPMYQTYALHPQCHLLFIVPYLILLSVQILDVDDSKSLDFTEVLWLRPPPFLIPIRALLSMPTKACLVDQHARPIHFVMDRMQTHMRS